MIAWDGTAEEFWRAVKATRDNVDTEGEAAVLSEVLFLAQQAADFLKREPAFRRLFYAVSASPDFLTGEVASAFYALRKQEFGA